MKAIFPAKPKGHYYGDLSVGNVFTFLNSFDAKMKLDSGYVSLVTGMTTSGGCPTLPVEIWPNAEINMGEKEA